MDLETFEYIRYGLILYIILVCSLCVHEWAHAWVADQLGDPLPRSLGRVSLNPMAHMDTLGTVILPLVMIFSPLFLGGAAPLTLIGWGKPVPISLPKRATRVRDELLITAAGPLSNLALAIGSGVVGGFLGRWNPEIMKLFLYIIYLNCALFVFNLVPIPPLDGSHFLKHALRMKEKTFISLSRYGFLIMLVLVNWDTFRGLLSLAVNAVVVMIRGWMMGLAA